jgi:adenine-specific DNA glycosylase
LPPLDQLLIALKQVTHVFSHIHQTYLVESAEYNVSSESNSINGKWVTKEEFLTSAVSTAMKKVSDDGICLPQESDRVKII